MKNELLGWYKLPNRLKEDEAVPKIIYVYKDRVEIETWTLTFEVSGYAGTMGLCDANIEKCRKKFDYKDIILMNETLNRILRPKKWFHII